MPPHAPEACAAFMGRDWADAKHEVGLPAAGAARRACLVRAHRPAAIDAWGQPLRMRLHGPPVAVWLELRKGPMGSARRPEAFLVLFSVHPLPLARYRAALPPSRATDDPTDAARQVALRLQPRDTLPPRSPPSPPRRAWAPCVAPRQRLVGDPVRCTPRLTSALNHSFPHVLPWLQEHETALLCDWLRRWPTRTAAPRARRTTLERFCRAHHVRQADGITTRSAASKRAGARTPEAGLILPTTRLVPALVAPLRGPVPAMADGDTAMAHGAQGPPAFPWLAAVPGAGAGGAPRLLGAWGAPRERSASAEARHK
jgi:hypothetical protein